MGEDRDLERRDFLSTAAAGAVGTLAVGASFGAGVVVANRYLGGDASNTQSNREQDQGRDNSSELFDDGDSSSDSPESSSNSSSDTPTDNSSESTDSSSDSNSSGIPEYTGDETYGISDSVEIDLGNLDPLYNDSSVSMGVQDNGNLVAWNNEVETSEGLNPLWRFKSEDFPEREFYSVNDNHPLERVYDELSTGTEQMSVEMVEAFYDETDSGSLEDHRSYKPIEFEDLKNGLIQYGSRGQAQDYFFNRERSLEEETGVLEQEWQELLQDSE